MGRLRGAPETHHRSHSADLALIPSDPACRPRAVRNEVSLLYLLAGTADTLADSLHGEGDVGRGIATLRWSMEGPSSPIDFSDLIRLQDDPSEAELRVEEISCC